MHANETDVSFLENCSRSDRQDFHCVNPWVLELGRHRSASSHLASEAKEAKEPIQREDEGDLTSQSSTKGKRYAPLRLINRFTEYLTPRSRRHRILVEQKCLSTQALHRGTTHVSPSNYAPV